MTAFPSYSTGTIAIAANAAVAIGTGTNWNNANVMPGDLLIVAGHQVIIEDVTDITHLAIDAWPFTAVAAATAYKVVQCSPIRFGSGQAMLKVNQLVQILNGMGTIYAVTGSAPDPSIGDDGQYALKTNAVPWVLWLKVGGVWVNQGTPVGTNYRGAWGPAVNYAPNDTVTSGGQSYISKTNNINKSPPTNTSDWDLLAAKGDTGAQGAQGIPGVAATINVAGTTTGAPGSSATVTNLGSSSGASFQFAIPRGDVGAQGATGPAGTGITPDSTGTLTDRATHDGATTGYKFLQTDVSPFRLFVKASNTSGDWAGPTFIGGSYPVGDMGHITDAIVQTYDFGHIV